MRRQPGARIDDVVALADAVVAQHDAARARRPVADLAEDHLHLVVLDRLVGQRNGGAGDVGVHATDPKALRNTFSSTRAAPRAMAAAAAAAAGSPGPRRESSPRDRRRTAPPAAGVRGSPACRRDG